ncbi:hypothetical protein [Bacillus suaedaesalsae]|uniref:Uncharacterized protein n=1 Tax=Bacillus suaedaesalsae TaxID=2810349 RepID=A0ABS2DNG8_9BACI|nr:hypothetical protein [Bacillus suaedaesalsae]MBM6619605.1 hypothetical protein [Bacillus suaedaesalsae]
MKKYSYLVLIVVVVVLLFLMISGYRFTALSAANANSFLSNDAELMEEYTTSSYKIFLFKSDIDKQYQSVLSEKFWLFYRSPLSTNIPYSSDNIQTIGGISITTEDDAATMLSVISHDDEVAYIEAGDEHHTERKNVTKGERISFLFPFSQQIDHLHATAYNQNGKPLYYYGYPKSTNVFRSEDLKWHKID